MKYTAQINLEKFVGAQDHTEAYCAARQAPVPQEYVLIPTDVFPPEEELFAADSPIDRHKFTKDQFGRFWLDKILFGTTDKVYNPTELVYPLARLIGFDMTESFVYHTQTQKKETSRFLPNAMDCRFLNYEDVPSKVRETVLKNLDQLWAFTYLALNPGDLQFIFTPRGHTLAMDYGPSYFVDPVELGSLPPGHSWDESVILDVDAQRSCIKRYRKYIGSRNCSEDFQGELEKGIRKVEGLTNKQIVELCQRLPSRARIIPAQPPIENYPDKVAHGLCWRRDNIREVFHDVL